MILLFDAANTLIHKPQLQVNFLSVLKDHAIEVDESDFRKNHKLVSECYHFPNRTNKEFYAKFNRDVLYSLGIIPTDELLSNIFEACSYLTWEVYEDTKFLKEWPYKKSVLSNFHGGLNAILDVLFPGQFVDLSISEEEKLRKPDLAFYERAIEKLGVNPSEIIYIGDSVKLDLEPGLATGMNAWLIDRDNYFPHCTKQLNSLKEIENMI